jgi:hypothetical protein
MRPGVGDAVSHADCVKGCAYSVGQTSRRRRSPSGQALLKRKMLGYGRRI